MILRIFDETVLFHAGPVPVTDTMITSLAVSILLIMAAQTLRRAVVRRPDSAAAAVATLLVESIDGLVTDIVGRTDPLLVTLSGSLAVFIAACNVAGQLPGVHPATASIATTSALAAVVFLAVPVAGVLRRGVWRYLRSYLLPNPLFMPLHVISELSRTIALSVRLFGNIMSGHLVVAILVALGGFLVPMPMMALDILIGLLQAYIFAILATVYVGAALSAEEGKTS